MTLIDTDDEKSLSPKSSCFYESIYLFEPTCGDGNLYGIMNSSVRGKEILTKTGLIKKNELYSSDNLYHLTCS